MLPRIRFEHFPAAKKEGRNTNGTNNPEKRKTKLLLQPILTKLLESHESKETVEKVTDTERERIIESLIDLKGKVDRQIYNGLQLKKEKEKKKKYYRSI